ncbi:MAG: hypothetical protein ACXIUD_15030 [Mongoliitalea sp.]
MEKIARFFSVIGHPLLVGPLYVMFMAFTKLSTQEAMLLSGMVIGVVTVPIIVHNYYKVKKGSYTNFDVSQREQRKGFYPFLLLLFVCIQVLIYVSGLPREVSIQTLIFTVLLVVSYGVNFYLKSSLHAAIIFYICFSVLNLISFSWLALLTFAFLTAWSRVYTQRHQVSEVVVGGVLGAVFGWMAMIV